MSLASDLLDGGEQFQLNPEDFATLKTHARMKGAIHVSRILLREGSQVASRGGRQFKSIEVEAEVTFRKAQVTGHDFVYVGAQSPDPDWAQLRNGEIHQYWHFRNAGYAGFILHLTPAANARLQVWLDMMEERLA